MIRRRKKIIFSVLGSIILGFVILTVFVSLFPTSDLDIEFSEEVQEHQQPIVDAAMKWISFPGQRPYSIIMVVLTSFAFLIFKLRKEALFTLFTLLTGVISYSLKILINRPRPTEPLVRIIESAKHQSFPSGHVLFYVVFFGFLVMIMYHLKSLPRRIRLTVGLISLFLIFSIPVSRVYLGAHWFTDVLGSFFLGILCLSLLGYLYFRKP